MSYELIETIELASSASSIEFTSIPQDGTDLVVKLSARQSTTFQNVFVQINGLTADYSFVSMQGGGSSVSTRSETSQSQWFAPGVNRADGTTTANTFSSLEIYFSNYASSSAKSISWDAVTENNATNAFQVILAGTHPTTSGITSVEFSLPTFVEGSTASLYKITAA